MQGICSECDYHTGYRRCDFGESADCIKNYNSYYNCIQKYGCADVISTDSKTCAYSKCSGQIKAM